MSGKNIFIFLGIIIIGIFFFTSLVEAASLEDVLINEIMWMGSTASDTDEWLELRNASDTAIDLQGWTIENALQDATLTIDSAFCSTTTVPASGYFLIGNATSGYSSIVDSQTVECATDTLDLADNYLLNGALILRDTAGEL
jgi:hypothetical protein